MANILRVKRPSNPSTKWKPLATDLTAGEISVGYPTSSAPNIATDPIVLYYYDGTNLRILGDKYFAALPSTNGIMVKKSDGTTTTVSITAGSNISVTNGDGTGGNPTVSLNSNISITSATLSGDLTLNSASITASRLLAVDSSKKVVSTDLTNWISVGTNLTKSANNGAVTLDIVSTPTFNNVTLNNLTANRIPYVNSSKALADSPITVSGSDISVAGNITINGTPSSDNHAVTKAYVDNLARGLKAKQSCRVATTGNVNLSNPGTSTFDGVTVSSGDRILVWRQTNSAENGIYVFNGSSSAMTRAADADSWDELVSAFVFVEQGNTYSDKAFYCTVDRGGTLGTDPITWVQFANISVPDAGDGLYLQNGAYNVGAGNGITVSADSVSVNADTTKGLDFASGKLIVKRDNTKGLDFDASGNLFVNADTTKGIKFDASGKLYVAINTSQGLAYNASGQIQIDDTTFSKIHTQNTDLGTSNTSFYIGPSNDQIRLVKNSTALDIKYYNGTTESYTTISSSALKLNTATNNATVQFTGSSNSTYTLDFVSGQTTYTLLTNYSVIDGGSY
jgi:hypothetical protein